jgi:hypothetical protein
MADEGITGVRARGNGHQSKFRQQYWRQVFRTVYSQIDRPVDQCSLDLPHEHPRAADGAQRCELLAIAFCANDSNLDWEIGSELTQRSQRFFSLLLSQLAAARPDNQPSGG